MDICIFKGRTGAEIELKQTQSGTSYARFSIAVQTGFGDNKRTSWLPCTAWGKLAESMAKWVGKGTAILVTCEAIENKYTDKNGNNRRSIEFTVKEWEFAGSKKDNEVQEKQAASNQTLNTGDDDFMSVPEGIDEELPFA